MVSSSQDKRTALRSASYLSCYHFPTNKADASDRGLQNVQERSNTQTQDKGNEQGHNILNIP